MSRLNVLPHLKTRQWQMLPIVVSLILIRVSKRKSASWASGVPACSNLRGFFVVTLIAGRNGPVPAVLKALTVRKYCVFPSKLLTVTDVWFQGTLTFPIVSGLVSSSQYATCLRQRAHPNLRLWCHHRDVWHHILWGEVLVFFGSL